MVIVTNTSSTCLLEARGDRQAVVRVTQVIRGQRQVRAASGTTQADDVIIPTQTQATERKEKWHRNVTQENDIKIVNAQL